tara:strand:- start:115 stop:441 length:327 start_codon:yes stop_codon:yes gene_type:complete
MAITGLQGLEIWRDGLDGGNSDSLAEIITDDFVFVPSSGESMSRDEALTFTQNAGVHISDFEVLHDNDEVAFGFHSAQRQDGPLNKITFFARKEDDKFSYWKVVMHGQ